MVSKWPWKWNTLKRTSWWWNRKKKFYWAVFFCPTPLYPLNLPMLVLTSLIILFIRSSKTWDRTAENKWVLRFDITEKLVLIVRVRIMVYVWIKCSYYKYWRLTFYSRWGELVSEARPMETHRVLWYAEWTSGSYRKVKVQNEWRTCLL